jgi:hypothetical protein
MTWLLIVTVVTLNGSLYVAVPFSNLADCNKAGQDRVAAIYHPDAGEGADAYEVKDTFFKCQTRASIKQDLKQPSLGPPPPSQAPKPRT